MTMNEETLQRLDALAAKLNVTGEYLWAVLVAQARVAVIQDAVMAVVGCVLLFLSRWLWRQRSQERSWDNDSWELGCGVFLVAGSALLIIALTSIWTPLLNPEYYALSKVFAAMRGD